MGEILRKDNEFFTKYRKNLRNKRSSKSGGIQH